MFAAILGIFPFLNGILNPIAKISQSIADVKIQALKADTDEKKIAAQERLGTLEARKAVMIAESGSRVNAWIRAGFALPFVLYNAKLVVWDKVLASLTGGSTDGPSPDLFQVEIACIGFYFLYDITTRFKR